MVRFQSRLGGAAAPALRRRTMPGAILATLALMAAATTGRAQSAGAAAGCGEPVSIATHEPSRTRYALAYPRPAPDKPIALLLLVGGGGHLDLDDQACPRALTGNSLVRSIPHFNDAGFITALVDAPSDHPGEDGLGGFRIAPQHAEDIGKVIADLRARTRAAVWLVGTSRGTISAVNAAARLRGPAAPDGLVLTSALMAGRSGGQKGWVAQTVFDLPLESIRLPLLVVGHADDKCIRSPANLMDNISARARSSRLQVVTVSGGPGYAGPPGVNACEGRAPHGFVEQEAEVAAGIARFIGGGSY